MQKKLLSLGAIAMDIVLDSHELPKDDGFALIKNEVMLPGGSASNVSVCASHLEWTYTRREKWETMRLAESF